MAKVRIKIKRLGEGIVLSHLVAEEIAKSERSDIPVDSGGIRFPRVVGASEEIERGFHPLDRVVAGASAQYGTQVQELELVIFEIRAAVSKNAGGQVMLIHGSAPDIVCGDPGSDSRSDNEPARGINRAHISRQLVVERLTSGVE